MILLVSSHGPAVRGGADRQVTDRFEELDLWSLGHDLPYDPSAPGLDRSAKRATAPARSWVRGSFTSVQVNVDAQGNNIFGDAANEPSIAVDPTNATRMVIGWRQFDTIDSNFRTAGQAYSQNAGQTWTFPGVLEPGEFSSDPVVDVDASGRFYYYGLQPDRGPGAWACYMYKSLDGGVTWPQEVYAYGGDKAWFTIDRTGGQGDGHIYIAWSPAAGCCGNATFNRSTNGGASFSLPISIPESPRWGTLTVTPDGALFIVGGNGSGGDFLVVRSSNAQEAVAAVEFDQVTTFDMGGSVAFGGGPNPGGLLGQAWIASDHTDGPSNGNLYVLSSVDPPGNDPLDVMFARSTDGGLTWSEPVRINDDPNDVAWQWFGTMSVAPNGRIDVIWNDTRNDLFGFDSELYYAYSLDGGVKWSDNVPLSPSFDPHIGWPSQNKIGDYYDMVSDNFGASVAYAATFNGEQDVYYLRIGETDCNNNDTPDSEDVANGTSEDCNYNDIPDECETDCNGNGEVDVCDVWSGFSDDCNGNLIPDECDPDFDGDGRTDDCDTDADGDGVLNIFDDCPFTPLGVIVDQDGRPQGDSSQSCVIDLTDVVRLPICYANGGPGVNIGSFCATFYDYDQDGEMDLEDIAAIFRDFGRQ
jgi:hypothetical protein